MHADSYQGELRYETWVMLRSRPVQPRHTGRSSLRPDQFIDRVTDFLRVAAPAWDPYAAA